MPSQQADKYRRATYSQFNAFSSANAPFGIDFSLFLLRALKRINSDFRSDFYV